MSSQDFPQITDSSQVTVGRSSPILKRDVGFGIRAAAGIPELLQLFGEESEVVELLAIGKQQLQPSTLPEPCRKGRPDVSQPCTWHLSCSSSAPRRELSSASRMHLPSNPMFSWSSKLSCRQMMSGLRRATNHTCQLTKLGLKAWNARKMPAARCWVLPSCHSKKPVLSPDDRLLIHSQLTRPLAIQVWIIPAGSDEAMMGGRPTSNLPAPRPNRTGKTTATILSKSHLLKLQPPLLLL